MMKHRGDERGERDSEYERKGQPGVKRREGEGFGISGKARRENECDDAGGDLDEGGKREKGKCRRAQRLPGEEPGFRGRQARERRHDRRVEAALPEDAAQEVRKPECGKKGVRGRPRAKGLREHDVAGKSEEPRKGRRRADEDCGTDE